MILLLLLHLSRLLLASLVLVLSFIVYAGLFLLLEDCIAVHHLGLTCAVEVSHSSLPALLFSLVFLLCVRLRPIGFLKRDEAVCFPLLVTRFNFKLLVALVCSSCKCLGFGQRIIRHLLLQGKFALGLVIAILFLRHLGEHALLRH